MYRMLIVDDEIHAVEGILSGVNWEKLSIKTVFTAYTAKQAKELFKREHIDIMICDIEMPQTSGLELTEWVGERYPKTETIILTCHADFGYAKQAIQLGSLDYILKPVPFAELELVIEKAKEKIDKESEMDQYSRFGHYWFKNQPMLIERFWQDILNQTVPSISNAVRLAAAERNIPYLEEMVFIPILISIQRWHKPLSLREEKILEYGLKNSAEEIFLELSQDGLIIALNNRRMLAVLSVEASQILSLDLETISKKYIDDCSRYFYCDISCYIGQNVQAHEMLGMVNKLNEMDRNNVAYSNKVFMLSKSPTHSSKYAPANITLWSVMLKEGAFDEVCAEASKYLNNLEKEFLNADLLNRLYQDFQQMMFYVLQSKGIQANHLYSDAYSQELGLNAPCSVSDLLEWVIHMISKAKEYVMSLEKSQSVVEKVIQYIQIHISEDLPREEIANQVFLNPDYLTRIFKKQTGMSISEYMFKERLRLAQELLAKTELPISAVATQIGYANFSHFSRMFKKHTSMNPNEFRQLHIKQN
ncbi:helix-turn-helix domain-containing protein [Paenibacillus sp. 276b]|uniref:helix-turn-helix domain-containing protein n=1 Tax=Paenibacillus sp. 276b TaxID=1566277 RepID=UPI00089943A4|nr:helix-turn-helix domain-containing protein [Paenibacillus sp. 276b]SEA61076.1 two-component system, response regulator YesN [Paenibacillus sp. 276b]